MTRQRGTISIRPVQADDYEAWRPLWDDYNAFYDRVDSTALPDDVIQTTWRRFFDANEPVHCIVADRGGRIVGICHYIFHRNTIRIEPICYLQDLYTMAEERGHGVGRALILATYERAKDAGCKRVYWNTHATNTPARTLYDKVARHFGFIVYAKDVE